MPEQLRTAMLARTRLAADRVRELVDEVLAMARAGALTADVEPVRAAAALERAAAGAVGVRVEVLPGAEAAGTLLADPSQLQQVLGNLVANAAKHGGGPVELGARAVPGGVELRVRDHGPGVPAAFVPHLFERGSRAPGTAAEGTGLGLHIVRRLVAAAGGEVRYEDAAPGARFVVRLPAAGADGPAEPAAPALRASA
ncbi:ATP-binding protein [Vallicoccus soli]|uniref:histidine kinase n=2 Tax=Vallicoccus soli TaxID=2339232 RepID=A0A3A3Z4M0_9ACTN|nr:ATP-binding protein [Vallicoccus soli]